MGVEILVPWLAFHRACCSLTENGKPLPINELLFCKSFNVLSLKNGPDADFLIKFNTEEDATLFLLKWS